MSNPSPHLIDVGTRFRFRMVDGIMFSEILPPGFIEPDPSSTLVDVGTHISFKPKLPAIHIPVYSAA